VLTVIYPIRKKSIQKTERLTYQTEKKDYEKKGRNFCIAVFLDVGGGATQWQRQQKRLLFFTDSYSILNI
jgi:hypothetical protein